MIKKLCLAGLLAGLLSGCEYWMEIMGRGTPDGVNTVDLSEFARGGLGIITNQDLDGGE